MLVKEEPVKEHIAKEEKTDEMILTHTLPSGSDGDFDTVKDKFIIEVSRDELRNLILSLPTNPEEASYSVKIITNIKDNIVYLNDNGFTPRAIEFNKVLFDELRTIRPSIAKTVPEDAEGVFIIKYGMRSAIYPNIEATKLSIHAVKQFITKDSNKALTACNEHIVPYIDARDRYRYTHKYRLLIEYISRDDLKLYDHILAEVDVLSIATGAIPRPPTFTKIEKEDNFSVPLIYTISPNRRYYTVISGIPTELPRVVNAQEDKCVIRYKEENIIKQIIIYPDEYKDYAIFSNMLDAREHSQSAYNLERESIIVKQKEIDYKKTKLLSDVELDMYAKRIEEIRLKMEADMATNKEFAKLNMEIITLKQRLADAKNNNLKNTANGLNNSVDLIKSFNAILQTASNFGLLG